MCSKFLEDRYILFKKGVEMMKDNIVMIFIIGILIFANILVYLFNINPTLMLILVTFSAAFYKAFNCEKFSDIYNVQSFKYTLNSKNLLELLGSFILVLIACKNIHNFGILDVFIFIIFSLLVYRFLFYNLSRKLKIN